MVRIKLNQDEKDTIEMIAVSKNLEVKQVQEIFLALVTYYTLQLYSQENKQNKEFIIPYIGKIKVEMNKEVIPKGFKLKPKIDLEISENFYEILDKISKKEETWIENLCIQELFKTLEEKVKE